MGQVIDIPQNQSVVFDYRRTRDTLKLVFNIVIGVETWFNSYEQENKRLSVQWVCLSEESPTKVRRIRNDTRKLVSSFSGPLEDHKADNAE